MKTEKKPKYIVYTTEIRQFKRAIMDLKNQQRYYRNRWLLLDIKINNLTRNVDKIIGGMKRCHKKLKI